MGPASDPLLQKRNKCAHRRGNPLIFVPHHVGGDNHIRACPRERHHSFASDFSRYHYLWQQSHAHPHGNALSDGLDAREFCDIPRTNSFEREYLVQFLTVTTSRFGEQQSLPAQVLGFHFFHRRKRMFRGSKQENLFVTKTHRFQSVSLDLVHHQHRQIKLTDLQRMDQLLVVVRPKRQRHLWIEPSELAENSRQTIGEHGFVSANRQRPRRDRILGHSAMGLVERRENLVRIRQEAPSGIRQNDAFRQAVEERRAQFLFERADLGGYIGLHAMHARCRSGEVQLFCERLKNLELPDLHAHHLP